MSQRYTHIPSKTIRITSEAIKKSVAWRLSRHEIKPTDLTLKDMRMEYRRYLLIIVERSGFRLLFNDGNKDYLLIYNK